MYLSGAKMCPFAPGLTGSCLSKKDKGSTWPASDPGGRASGLLAVLPTRDGNGASSRNLPSLPGG